MTSRVDQNLANILNTDYKVIDAEIETDSSKKLVAIENNSEIEEIKTDAAFARTNLLDLINVGNHTIDSISQIARESNHPRAFEVLGQIMKTQSENLDKLMKLQKDKKELLKGESKPNSQESAAGINVEQAVFVGSTAELLDALNKS